VQSFLVEVYLPRSRAHEARASGRRARAAAVALAHEGVPIRYIRTTYLPDDETCFHVFEAVSTEVVEEAGRRAGLGRVRIVPAIETSGPARRRAKGLNSSGEGSGPCRS
jgi:hypothetical protein